LFALSRSDRDWRDLDACAEGSLSDGAIVYNGKFAADKDLVLGVYKNAY